MMSGMWGKLSLLSLAAIRLGCYQYQAAADSYPPPPTHLVCVCCVCVRVCVGGGVADDGTGTSSCNGASTDHGVCCTGDVAGTLQRL
jgi:hypothetical protein